jgi:hypothetical protein
MYDLRHSTPSLPRRKFVSTVAGAAAVLAGSTLAARGATDRAAPAASTRRRVIWNNDGDDLRFVAFRGTRSNRIERLWSARDPNHFALPERFSSVQEFLDLRMTALRDIPVDTISFCGVFNWPAWEMPRDRIAVLGDDPIRPIVEFTHGLGKEFFFNIRMNDCHSSVHFRGPAWWEPFRQSSPHLLQSNISAQDWERVYLPWIRGESETYPLQAVEDRRGPGNRDLQSWSAFDYARPEVRDYFLGLVRQVAERYDVDGIDLDWLRWPYFFRFGDELRGIPLMNDFVRRVADTVRARAKRRGRPIVIAMRVPDTPERAAEIGLDVVTWIREGWVDVLVAGNGMTFSAPLQRWIELAAPRQIPVYGCITQNAPGLADPAAVRGASQALWQQGVSGLYHFNHFIPAEYGTITDGADRARLAGLTKTYQVDSSFVGRWNGTVFSGPLPLDFTSCVEEAVIDIALAIPESLAGARALRLEAGWQGDGLEARTRWQVNGIGATREGAAEGGKLRYRPEGLRSGQNQLRVTVQPARPGTPVILQSVRITVERAERA